MILVFTCTKEQMTQKYPLLQSPLVTPLHLGMLRRISSIVVPHYIKVVIHLLFIAASADWQAALPGSPKVPRDEHGAQIDHERHSFFKDGCTFPITMYQCSWPETLVIKLAIQRKLVPASVTSPCSVLVITEWCSEAGTGRACFRDGHFLEGSTNVTPIIRTHNILTSHNRTHNKPRGLVDILRASFFDLDELATSAFWLNLSPDVPSRRL
jgi:hypothetical protein